MIELTARSSRIPLTETMRRRKLANPCEDEVKPRGDEGRQREADGYRNGNGTHGSQARASGGARDRQQGRQPRVQGEQHGSNPHGSKAEESVPDVVHDRRLVAYEGASGIRPSHIGPPRLAEEHSIDGSIDGVDGVAMLLLAGDLIT